jgi:hypothetical protein
VVVEVLALVDVVDVVAVDVVTVEIELDVDVLGAAVVDDVDDETGVNPATAEVASEVASADPFLFDAVTATRNVRPTSPDDTTYEVPVADPIAAHPEPPESQLNH